MIPEPWSQASLAPPWSQANLAPPWSQANLAPPWSQASVAPMDVSRQVQDVCEALLTFADKLGAVCSESYRKIGAACVEGYQTTAMGASEVQAALSNGQGPGWSSNGAPPRPISDRLVSLDEGSFKLRDQMTETSRKIRMAYLDARIQAALATADFQQQLGAASGLEPVNAACAASADLIREGTKTAAEAMRQLESSLESAVA